MNDKTDALLKSYFSDKNQPPPETKAILQEKLRMAALQKEARWRWAIILYAVLFSITLAFALWIITSNSVIVFVSLVYLLISSVGGAIITIACQKAKTKGGFFKCHYSWLA